MKTQKEINDIKAQWRRDPWDYDLEDTVGFEAHRDELREFRLSLEREWEAERIEAEAAEEARILAFAKFIGCADNLPLARQLDRMEKRLNAGFSIGH